MAKKKNTTATAPPVENTKENNDTVTKNVEKQKEPEGFVQQLIAHFLTPGSALSGTVWTIFNVMIGLLYCCWAYFCYHFYDNIHIWVFGFLITGLAITTNMFFQEVFARGDDYDTVRAKQKRADKTKKDQ